MIGRLRGEYRRLLAALQRHAAPSSALWLQHFGSSTLAPAHSPRTLERIARKMGLRQGDRPVGAAQSKDSEPKDQDEHPRNDESQRGYEHNVRRGDDAPKYPNDHDEETRHQQDCFAR